MHCDFGPWGSLIAAGVCFGVLLIFLAGFLWGLHESDQEFSIWKSRD